MRADDEPAPSDDGPKDGPPRKLGALLRAEREARYLSIEQVSEQLRIEPRFLTALEEERYEALGAAVFLKGYVKLYAECLGLDARRLLETYRDELAGPEPVVQARRSVETQRQRPPVILVAAAAAVLALAGFWLFGVDRGPEPDDVPDATADAPAASGAEGRAAAPQRATAENEDAGTAAPRDGGPADTGGAPAGEAPDSGAFAIAEEGEPPNVPADPSAAAETETPTEAEAGADDLERAGPPGPDPGGPIAFGPPAGDLAIALRFVEDSWAEVTDAAGERLFYGLGRAGSEARFTAAAPVDVLLGNADGVAVEVDGAAFSYPAGSRRGKLARFILTAEAD